MTIHLPFYSHWHGTTEVGTSLARGHGDGVDATGGGSHGHGDVLGKLPGGVVHIGRGHGEYHFFFPIEEQNLPVFLQLRRQILHLNGDHIGRNILLAVKDDIFLHPTGQDGSSPPCLTTLCCQEITLR